MRLSEFKGEFEKTLSELYEKAEIQSLYTILLHEVFGWNRLQVNQNIHQIIPSDKIEMLSSWLQQLELGKPIQYIIGSAPFFGMQFYVNEHTLIPRPETEELVDLVVRRHSNMDNLNILDIGTGSGCIAISLAKKIENAKLTAVDISPDTLSIAQKNAVINDTNVRFLPLDILSPAALKTFTESEFDIIVSNPPYVTQKEKSEMSKNVLDYEPHSALFVPNQDPLIFYKRIADLGQYLLRPGGLLYLEINQYYSRETSRMLSAFGYINVDIHPDINGADRMISAIYTSN